MILWEILVPTQFEDNKKPVRLAHHRRWDLYASKFSNGLTIIRPAKGYWTHEGKLYSDRVIPVRLTCSRQELEKILKFTKSHYRQIAVMAYKLSSEVIIYKD
jgi:hypothetical protein